MNEQQVQELGEKIASRRIVVAVTGGIAAYKTCELVSSLVKSGADVKVVMTANARRFVGEATFRALTGHPVAWDMFAEPTADEIEHISLAEFADVIAVVPATADVLGKVAAGVCDDLVTTTICSARGPIVLAPAMNWRMWENPIVQRNCECLKELGYCIVEPEMGRLACGEEGWGRLASQEAITAEIAKALEGGRAGRGREGALAEKRVLITAGPTREHLDPVRFISNASSGKMGFALARAARVRGAEVILVSGPTNLAPPPGVEVVAVESAAQMHQAVMQRLAGTDVFIGAAAVANFSPRASAEEKMPSNEAGLAVELVATPHILGDVAGSEDRPAVVVGFAAETEDLQENAARKLHEYGLDLIVANDVTAPGAGFAVDTNQVTIMTAEGTACEVSQLAKDEIARIVLDQIEQLLRIKQE